MPKREIYLQKNVICPACKTPNMTKFPNPRLYVAAKREADMHVISYRWAEGAETNVLPHYFAVWQCPQCMFGDLADNIMGPKGPSGLSEMIKAFSDLSMKDKLLLASIRKMVDPQNMTFEGSLAMHLNALFINSLPEKEYINHNKIGRIALRIGWLYRETMGDQQVEESDSDSLKKLQENTENLEQSLLTISDTLAHMIDLGDRRAQELGLDETGKEEKNPYKSVIESMSDKQNDMHTLLTMLQRTLMSDSMGKIVAAEKVEDSGLDGLSEKLFGFKEKWPKFPVTEEQALRMAIDAFDYSYKYENYYQSIEQSMSVVSLIVELYTRIGKIDDALTYVAEIYKGGMRNKQDLQNRMSHGRKNQTMSEYDEKLIRRKIGTIDTAIRSAGETRRKIIKLIIDRDKAKIDKILAPLQNASGKEQVQALRNGGISDEIIIDLKARKLIKDDKKKGLFGF